MSIIKQLQKDLNTRDCVVSEKMVEVYDICKELQVEEFTLALEDEMQGYDELDSVPEHRIIQPLQLFRIEDPKKKKRVRFGMNPRGIINIPNDDTNPYLHIIRYEDAMESIGQKGYFVFYASIKTLEEFLKEEQNTIGDEKSKLEKFMCMKTEYFLENSKDMLIDLLKGFERIGVLGENGIFSQKEKDIVNNL